MKCLLRCKCTYFKDISSDLLQLIEDKAFKGAVSTFNIEKLSNVAHRDELLEIVMSIIHMKLLSKPNKNARLSYLAQKRQVIEFLKKFPAQDLNVFFQIIFKSLMERDNKANEIYSNKSLLWTLQLVNLILMELFNQIDQDGMKFLLKVIFKVSHVSPVNQAADIRSKLYGVLCGFFEKLSHYEWTNAEWDELFGLFIWPRLSNLHSDSSQSCSGLFKLIIEWSKDVNYFHLLNRDGPEGIGNSIQNVIKLLENTSTSKQIKEVIFSFLSRLVQTDSKGIEIVTPYLTTIFERIIQNLQAGEIDLNQCELIPLLSIQQDEKHESEINKLISILFTLLHKYTQKKTADETKVEEILDLLSHSITFSSNPLDYAIKLANFFDRITDLNHRRKLCKVAKSIFNINDYGQKVYIIIEHFNALDRRWTDQPDYKRRLKTFDLISEYFPDTKEWKKDFAILIFYSCMYILSNDKDMVMRDQAFDHLVKSCDVFLTSLDEQQSIQILENTVLNTITTKLKNPECKCRSKCIKLLNELSHKYSNQHTVLSDLKELSKESHLNFLQDIVYIQENTQRKAIMHYTKLINSKQIQPSQRTLTQFILPIITHYTCNDMYSKKPALIEAVVTSISATATLLTWNNYEQILKYYLKKLSTVAKHQKQLINICVGILNSFHFKDDCKVSQFFVKSISL